MHSTTSGGAGRGPDRPVEPVSPPSGAPRLKDVAARAGVSSATVSRVINESVPVSPATRERILSAIRELNYVPDALARGTARRRSQVLGMIVPNITNPYFAELYRAAAEAAFRHHYIVWVLDTNESVEREAAALNTFQRFRVDAILITPVDARANRERYGALPMPLCFVDREVTDSEWDFVGVDNVGGAKMATRLLMESGHRRIATITGPQSSTSGVDRLRGYRAALEESGLSVPPDYVQIGNFHEASGYAAGLRLLALPNQPTAVMVANSLMALGLLQALHQKGGELAIIAFDDFPLAALATPPITVVALPSAKLGSSAVTRVLHRLKSPDARRRRLIVAPKLVVRGSEQLPPRPDSG